MPKTPPDILVVDDDENVVDWLVESLEEAHYAAVGATRADDALAKLSERRFDVVVSDVEMPGMRGTELLAQVRGRHPGVHVILITAFGSIDLAMETVRMGAADFIAKPFPIDCLLVAIDRCLGGRAKTLDEPTPEPADDAGLVAESPAMQRAVSLARRAAATDAVVLITGESGVGKGALARAIHDWSARAAAPFIQLNCAALPAALVESELFGVRRGAFTDAKESRPGLFGEANGGTLFLDEVGELPAEAQPKLLQAVETARVRPVGATTEVAVDARVIAATNAPLEEAVRERRFRPDLYYRLNVIRIDIPPIRQRPEDLEPLARLLLAQHARRLHRARAHLTDAALTRIRSYAWPGNVRELSNALERALTLSEDDAVALEDVGAAAGGGELDGLGEALAREATLADVELAYIRRVLDAVDGNVASAARILGIDRRTVYRKLEQL